MAQGKKKSKPKILTKEVSDLVARFGIEVVLLEKVAVDDLADGELRMMWRKAKDALYAIELFLEKES